MGRGRDGDRPGFVGDCDCGMRYCGTTEAFVSWRFCVFVEGIPKMMCAG
jgi:hypothetical protein